MSNLLTEQKTSHVFVQIAAVLSIVSILVTSLWSVFTLMRDVQENTRQNTLLIQQIQKSQMEISTYSTKIFNNETKTAENSIALKSLMDDQAAINSRNQEFHTEIMRQLINH